MVWSLFADRRSLWTTWIQSHYMRNKSFWGIKEAQNQSWNWKSLLRLRPFAKRYVRGKLGNGKRISFWHDYWTPFGPLLEFIGPQGPRLLRLPLGSKVADACSKDGWSIPGARSDREVQLHAYLSTLPSPASSTRSDGYTWLLNGVHSNKFSSALTWNEIRSRGEIQPWAGIVWFKGAIPAHAFHLWVTQWNRLPTMLRMSRWLGNIQRSPLCVRCLAFEESRDHVFFSCSFAGRVWDRICGRLKHPRLHLINWNEMMTWLAHTRGKDIAILSRLTAHATIYNLWKQRNNLLHNGVRLSPDATFKLIDNDIRCAISGRRSRRSWSRLMERWFSTSV